MSVPRRDFMKLLGISLGSLLLARCQVRGVSTPYRTCCMVGPSTPTGPTPTPKFLTARERVRLCWLRFGELAQWTRDAAQGKNGGGEDNAFGNELAGEHRKALDELVSGGDLFGPVADLIQEAYGAAVYHVWRLNAAMTCYEPVIVNFAPASADILVHQSEVLAGIAAGGMIDPETLESARSALEHDLAFYALTDREVQALYTRLLEDWQEKGGSIPSFDGVEFTLTPDVHAAARFLLDLLVGK